MIDKLVSSVAGVGGPNAVGVSATPTAALSGDVDRFQWALNGPAPSSTAPAGVPLAGGPAAAPNAVAFNATGSTLAPASAADTASVAARAAQSGRRSVGDAILDSFRSVASNASNDWGQARQAIMSPSLTTAEMLQTQMKLIQVSFQIDLIGKGVSKVTTNLEQTLKTQ